MFHFVDTNPPGFVSGYNVYRSSDASVAPALWSLLASDVIDMDEAVAENQWADISGDIPPADIWYYTITAFNSRCPAEGPR